MIKIFADTEQLNRSAADKFVEIAGASIRSENGNFTVALAGGSTPKLLYQLLAGSEYKNKVDWTKVFFFFGDERNVSPNDKDSNFRLANENLFIPLQISETNILRWNTEIGEADIIAGDYETVLFIFFALDEENRFPKFDLILLGMGADGHTASLFPHTIALKEKKRNAVANPVKKLDTTRLTLTFPLINNARNVLFLIKGEEKAETLHKVLRGDFQPEKYPAQAVKLKDGKLLWLIEKQAARFLT
jgi:6-phosphogluconolactonase